MCAALTAAFVIGLMLLVPTGVLAWLAFLASIARRRKIEARVLDEGLRDDAGLTAFERTHLRQVLTGVFTGHPDAELRVLAAKAKSRLFLSAGNAAGVVLILLVRTAMHC